MLAKGGSKTDLRSGHHQIGIGEEGKHSGQRVAQGQYSAGRAPVSPVRGASKLPQGRPQLQFQLQASFALARAAAAGSAQGNRRSSTDQQNSHFEPNANGELGQREGEPDVASSLARFGISAAAKSMGGGSSLRGEGGIALATCLPPPGARCAAWGCLRSRVVCELPAVPSFGGPVSTEGVPCCVGTASAAACGELDEREEGTPLGN